MNGILTIIGGSDIDTYYEVESFLQAGDACIATEEGDQIGGCVLNVGMIASRLGMNVQVLDYLKENDPGTDLLIAKMKENGLDTSGIRYGKDVVNGRCLIMHQGNEKCIYVLLPKHPHYDLEDGSVQEQLNRSTVIYSLMHEIHDSFRDFTPLAEAQRHGARIAFDGSSQYQDPRDLETLCLADYVFLNKQAYQRICDLTGRDTGEYLLEKGLSLICVTDGSRGARCITKDGELYEKAPRIDHVVDSTGAGDTFAATFLVSLDQGLSYRECLKRSVYAGSRKCLYAGALGALCSLEELEAFIREKTEK